MRTVGALADTLSALRVRGEGHVTLNVLLAGVSDGIRHCEQIPLANQSLDPDEFSAMFEPVNTSLRVGKTRKSIVRFRRTDKHDERDTL